MKRPPTIGIVYQRHISLFFRITTHQVHDNFDQHDEFSSSSHGADGTYIDSTINNFRLFLKFETLSLGKIGMVPIGSR